MTLDPFFISHLELLQIAINLDLINNKFTKLPS